MGKVVITGVETPLGRRVARLVAEEEDADVVGLAAGPVAGLPARVAVYRVDLSGDDVKPHLQDADVLVHLATSVPATPTAATDDVTVTRRVLEAAGDGSVPHLVVLSSATVYGAWPDNPVPLTEEDPVRGNEEFAYSHHKRLVEEQLAALRSA
ncbi:MAG: NAD-dependent epimerase/dehydratase family protein, partial [Acidimicrobiia bacterium]